jgi:hypothetical protein
MITRKYVCSECLYRSTVVFNPVIGYGESGCVTRVDESVKLCHDCIPKMKVQRTVGRIVDWQLVEEEEDD